MKKALIRILALLVLVCVVYIASFFIFTNKYIILYTSNTCDIARTVNSEWERSLYYLAAVIELKIFGKPNHKPSLQIDTTEIHKYYSEQTTICSNK